MTLEELEKKMAELDELQAETENAHAKLKAQMAELEKLQAETENAHAKLIAQMAELKERDEEKLKPPHPRWKPEEEEQYYTINVGFACAGLNYWDCDTLDEDIYSLGCVFKTKAEAEFAIERQRVLAEMREWGGKWNDGIALMYNRFDDSIETIMRTGLNTFGEMRFATPEDAHNCVEAVGAGRIKKYYFMIPEDETNE